MSYIYKLKSNSPQKYADLGFEFLPADIYGMEQSTIMYKIEEQPKDGQCVQQLIDFYNNIANNIIFDKKARKAHSLMGIKFRKKSGELRLIVTDELREMFSLWRLEINLEDGDVYFTISDGSMPSFYDAELVLDKFCGEDINKLIENGLIEKCETGYAK